MAFFKRGKEVLYEISIKDKLYNFLNIHDYSEEKINHDLKIFGKQIEDFIEEYSKEPMTDQEEIEFEREIDNMVDFMDPYSNHYLNILRKSLTISIWSFYEHQLISFCRKNDPKINFKNSIIDEARKYIKSDMNIKFPDQDKNWIFLKNVKKVRNCIVHEGGFVTDDSALVNIIRKHLKNVDISPNNEILIEEKFIEELVNHIDNNLYSLLIKTEYL